MTEINLNLQESQCLDFNIKMRLIEIARLTDVRYVKRDVTPVPLKYKAWFVAGQEITIWRERKTCF